MLFSHLNGSDYRLHGRHERAIHETSPNIRLSTTIHLRLETTPTLYHLSRRGRGRTPHRVGRGRGKAVTAVLLQPGSGPFARKLERMRGRRRGVAREHWRFFRPVEDDPNGDTVGKVHGLWHKDKASFLSSVIVLEPYSIERVNTRETPNEPRLYIVGREPGERRVRLEHGPST